MSRLLRALLGALSLTLAWPALAIAPPAIVLARDYQDGQDVSRYLVSEKLDGVRAIWDGQTLRFRSGREIHAPAWFTAALPKQPLDGELWLGRGRFAELSGLVRRDQPDEAGWRQVRYMIFELPEASGNFSERVAAMTALLAQAGVPWLAQIRQFSVVDRKSLLRELDLVVQGGGEGLVLHRADAPYLTGRSEVLLKMKPQHDDEAVVVAHLPGKGRYAGQLGALRVRRADGREFSLGTGLSDAQRRDPPPLGVTVTYRFRELTAGGLPRFASFWRVRED